MREIQSSDAKARLPQLLDDVERGETIVITRHGRPIARIVPEPGERREEVAEAIEGLRKLRIEAGRLTLDELLALPHEGHRS